ncbi:MAG: hypothetical protein ACI89U_003376, partial [Gammaproteobacteria bacterium]
MARKIIASESDGKVGIFYNRYNTMTTIGTPFSPTATKVLMCGSGELGKEVTIEL